jgi:hypothetical protein
VRDNDTINLNDLFASPVQDTDEWGKAATHAPKPYQQDDGINNNEEE